MRYLVKHLPEKIEWQFLSWHADVYFVWDHVCDKEDNAILALALTTESGMCLVDDYVFADADDAAEEAYRLNRRLGLTDDEIADRIELVVDRELKGHTYIELSDGEASVHISVPKL